MSDKKTIAFFPEAAFGPALNSVGIAQACEALGHRAVFLTDPGMAGVYAGYGFEEHMVNMSEPMEPEATAWRTAGRDSSCWARRMKSPVRVRENPSPRMAY